MVTLYEVPWPEPLPLSGTRFSATYDWTAAVVGQTVQAGDLAQVIAIDDETTQTQLTQAQIRAIIG